MLISNKFLIRQSGSRILNTHCYYIDFWVFTIGKPECYNRYQIHSSHIKNWTGASFYWCVICDWILDWTEITLLERLCNSYTLSLKRWANPSTNIPCHGHKMVNLSHTTRIAFFPATSGNFVIKFTFKYEYVYSFFRTIFGIGLLASVSVQFFIYWYKSQSYTYLFTSLVIPGH